jgi:acetyl-CoA carboxylase carboxyl transferase subunit alpha
VKLTLEFERPIKELERRIEELRRFSKREGFELNVQISELERRLKLLKEKVFRDLDPWERTQVARHPDRPKSMDYIERIFDDFLELSGDRVFSDDPAIIAGVAKFLAHGVIVLGHRKGRDTAENLRCNFGMVHPEGYRKAYRVMKLAEKFGKPVISFVDTPGAYPGIGAEERGQGEAIARNLYLLSHLQVPVIVVVIGEGGSGGALAIGMGDRVLMLENAIYSVISPEGCAAILWSDRGKVREAAENLKLTAKDLYELGFIDEVIKEPLGGAHSDPAGAIESVKAALTRNLNEVLKIPRKELVEARYKKYRAMGKFLDKTKVGD